MTERSKNTTGIPKGSILDPSTPSRGGRFKGLTPEQADAKFKEIVNRTSRSIVKGLAEDNLKDFGEPIPDHLKDDQENEIPPEVAGPLIAPLFPSRGADMGSRYVRLDHGDSIRETSDPRNAGSMPERRSGVLENKPMLNAEYERDAESSLLSEAAGDFRVTWIDVSDCAKQLFNVWCGQPELRWAQKSWTALEANDLTGYGSETERYPVLIRLLVLADFYRQFCRDAFDESYDETDLYELCDHLISFAKFSPFRLGRLVDEDFVIDEDDEDTDESEVLNRAVASIAESLKDETIEALVHYFGSSEALFVSLRLSLERVQTVCPDPENLYLAGADPMEVEAWENFYPRRFQRPRVR